MSANGSPSRNGETTEENWKRLVRLLRDPACTGRADLMADAAKMIEQLVRFLDNAEQRAEAREREACTSEKRTTCSFAPSEIATTEEWTWSLDQPEVSGWQWVEYWTADKLPEPGVMRFMVGDTLPANCMCWRFIEPPKGGK